MKPQFRSDEASNTPCGGISLLCNGLIDIVNIAKAGIVGVLMFSGCCFVIVKARCLPVQKNKQHTYFEIVDSSGCSDRRGLQPGDRRHLRLQLQGGRARAFRIRP